jgi:hypothetical protein
MGQWLFAYTVAWSVFCLLALVPALTRLPRGLASDGLAALVAWVLATAAAVATCVEPKESGTAPRRYGIAILVAIPGLLVALAAGLTVVLLPALLVLSVFGSPILPWLHRGSPPWQRALLSVAGIAATAAILYAMSIEGWAWPHERWQFVALLGPFFAASSAIGALFALRTVGVPREVG